MPLLRDLAMCQYFAMVTDPRDVPAGSLASLSYSVHARLELSAIGAGLAIAVACPIGFTQAVIARCWLP